MKEKLSIFAWGLIFVDENYLKNNPKPSFQSRSIWARIDPNRIFNHNQSESFWPWINSDWFWLKIRFGSTRARIDLDWKLSFGLVWIYSDWCLGINRIKPDWFLTVFQQTRYKTDRPTDRHFRKNPFLWLRG